MSQLPFQVDGIKIEPGSGDILTITRDAADGSMKFLDAVLPSGVLLQNLVGIRNTLGLYVVGKTNAPYSTIQSALDAIPISSSSLLPVTVLVLPGVYQENLSIQKDGLTIIGFGAKILNSGDSSTVSISVSSDVTPKNINLRNIEIECTQAAKSCIEVKGADTFALGTITVATAPLIVGDTITIGGTVLVGVAGTRTSGLDNFSVSGGTPDTVAAEISAALNDTGNSFATTVSTSPAGAVVTVTSVLPGAVGNGITLATSTVSITLSGANLSGGSSAGNLVCSEFLTVQDCILKSTGVGGFQIKADVVNFIRVLSGTFEGSASTSSCNISNCSSFSIEGTSWVNDIEFAYNNTTDQPNSVSCLYQLNNSPRVGDLTTNLIGVGTIELKDCNTGLLVSGGDRDLFVYRSDVGSLTLSDTVSVFLYNSDRGAITIAAGTPLLEETSFVGVSVFAGEASKVVSFGYTQTDANYKVFCTTPDVSIVVAAGTKTITGFTISASAALTGNVDFIVRR